MSRAIFTLLAVKKKSTFLRKINGKSLRFWKKWSEKERCNSSLDKVFLSFFFIWIIKLFFFFPSPSYTIDRSSDKKRQFRIDQNGVVRIQRTLDREETPRHQVKILAIDDGKSLKVAFSYLNNDI